MKWTSLDAITRSVLQQRQLPIHYYLQYLKYASDMFRELHFDTLRVVNAKRLPVSATGTVQLPCDFVDYTKVGIEIGQMVRPLHNEDGINRLPNVDANGRPTIYPEASSGAMLSGGGAGMSDRGESLGGYPSYHDGLLQDTFKLLPERNIIQLNQAVGAGSVILEYVSDGTYCDAATKVDVLAQKTIEDYQKWQASPSRDNEYSPEAKKFFHSWKNLRARKNPMTMEDIKRSVNSR